jgi:hypothetical protein
MTLAFRAFVSSCSGDPAVLLIKGDGYTILWLFPAPCAAFVALVIA